MKIGIIGFGVVGSTLGNWFKQNTDHEIKKRDLRLGYNDSLEFCDAIFICININQKVEINSDKNLTECINTAQDYCKNVFIKSTVLPGTNDYYKTISCPEFLTERIANSEMDRIGILCGPIEQEFLKNIFPNKSILQMRNTECELSKLAHNCFGAIKVTYFNLIHSLSQELKCDYDNVLKGVLLSGFINKPHTQVPGPDSLFGYGGHCFPGNIEMMDNFLSQYPRKDNPLLFHSLFQMTSLQNLINRSRKG